MRITEKYLNELCESMNVWYNEKMELRSTCGYYNLEIRDNEKAGYVVKEQITCGLSGREMEQFMRGMIRAAQILYRS